METIAGIKPSSFKIEEIALVKNNIAYCRFLNWISGEFDLFLKNEESNTLKVYFPNGWFSVGCFENQDGKISAVLNVEGKSKAACSKIMKRILSIHKHICRFHDD